MAERFDPARMSINATGRVIWTDPPAGVRRGSFVRGGVDPATLPGASESALELDRDELTTPERDPMERLADGLGGVDLPEVSAPPELAPADLPTSAPQQVEVAPSNAPGEPPELPAPVLSSAPPDPRQPLSQSEKDGLARAHEYAVNRWAATYPRPYTERELRDVGDALGLVLERYAGGLSQHAPLVALATVTMTVSVERSIVKCVCGEGLPAGARFCGACGSSTGGAGGACVEGCGVKGMAPGTRFCFGCGAPQAVRREGAPTAPAMREPEPTRYEVERAP